MTDESGRRFSLSSSSPLSSEEDDDPLAFARSLLRPNAKVFLRHSHAPGFLHADATWQGEYHLALIRDAPTGGGGGEGGGGGGRRGSNNNHFTALWQRDGRSATLLHTLRSPTDVIALSHMGLKKKSNSNSKKSKSNSSHYSVQVEDDSGGNGNVHAARVACPCDGTPGVVRIRWDRGDEEVVCLSRVSLGRRGGRRRNRRNRRSRDNGNDGRGDPRRDDAHRGAGVAVASSNGGGGRTAGTATNNRTNKRVSGKKRKRRAGSSAARTRKGRAAAARERREARRRTREEGKTTAKEDVEIEIISIDDSSSEEEEGEESPAKVPAAGDATTLGVHSEEREDVISEERAANASLASVEDETTTVAAAGQRSDHRGTEKDAMADGKEGDGTACELRASKANDDKEEEEKEEAEQEEEPNGDVEDVTTAVVAAGQRSDHRDTGNNTVTNGEEGGDTASSKQWKSRAPKADGGEEELEEAEGEEEEEEEEEEGPDSYVEQCAAPEQSAASLAEVTPSSRERARIEPTKAPVKVSPLRRYPEEEEDGSSSSSSDEEDGGDEESRAGSVLWTRSMEASGSDSEGWDGDGGSDPEGSDDGLRKQGSGGDGTCDSLSSGGKLGAGENRAETVLWTKSMEGSGSESEGQIDDGPREWDAGGEVASGPLRSRARRSATRGIGGHTVTASPPDKSHGESDDDTISSKENDTSPVTRDRPTTRERDASHWGGISPQQEGGRRSLPATPDGDPPVTADADAAGSSAVLLNGFCRSIPEIRNDPHRAVAEVQTMLAKAKTCDADSAEFRETLLDANMLLQQVLFGFNERTKFVRADGGGGGTKSPPSVPSNDGNKKQIVRLAKQFGLTRGEVTDLFARLDVDEHGQYSIDEAVPQIMERKNNKITDGDDSEEKGEEDDGDDRRHGDRASDHGERERRQQLELLGSRVRTVFENGKEYEGTISTIHYRVTYDDGDAETLVSGAEAFENLACNDRYHLNGSPSMGGEDLRCSALEIFSGCSLLSTLCKRKGMNVMSIDTDMNSNATIKSDFSSNYVQHLLSSQTFDFIHASPVCSTYSLLAGGKHRNFNNYNRTPESHEADAMLMKLYFFLSKALEKTGGATTVTIENPRAWMRHGNIMKQLFEKELGFKRFLIYYCQFGRGEQKATNIWTNDWKLGKILETIGGKCNCPRPHEEGVRGSGNRVNFAALPLKLCQIISTYVHSKHTQLKFDKFAKHGGVVPGEYLNEG